jgi:hypothetical protein
MRTLRYERNGEQSQRRAAASSPTSGHGRTTSSDSASYCLRPSWSRKRCRREAGELGFGGGLIIGRRVRSACEGAREHV